MINTYSAINSSCRDGNEEDFLQMKKKTHTNRASRSNSDLSFVPVGEPAVKRKLLQKDEEVDTELSRQYNILCDDIVIKQRHALSYFTKEVDRTRQEPSRRRRVLKNRKYEISMLKNKRKKNKE